MPYYICYRKSVSYYICCRKSLCRETFEKELPVREVGLQRYRAEPLHVHLLQRRIYVFLLPCMHQGKKSKRRGKFTSENLLFFWISECRVVILGANGWCIVVQCSVVQ